MAKAVKEDRIDAAHTNQLYYGDCLDVLKKLSAEHPKGFIDLIYIDPPFNSKRNYNILFESAELKDTKAQREAFADTWSNVSYKDTLEELVELNFQLSDFLNTLDRVNISKSAVSYLTTMAIRIWYMHKVLKETGSFYLHCDPTMSHYLKIVCDMIFGEKHFKNEIIWQRTNAHNMKAKYFGRVHDVILFYTKGKVYTWNEQYTEYSKAQLGRFKKDDTGRLYKAENLTFSSANANRQFEWRGVKPPANRSWGASLEQLEEWWEEGRILKKLDGSPRMDGLKVYLDTLKGKSMNDIWTDVERVGNTSSESLGYPTQKPDELLERIIMASSNEGDLVADFFCGCGTTIAAAQKLKRKWLGADISHLSIGLIEQKRLIEPYYINGVLTAAPKYEIHGFPRDIDGAKELAKNVKGGRLKFEQWIVEAKLNAILNEKKNEMGFDGHSTFDLDGKKLIIIEVKSGNASVTQLNHFIKTVDAKKGAIGVFVCFEYEVTQNMRMAAKSEGYFMKEKFGTTYDKIQILTVEDILNNKVINVPRSTEGLFKTAKKKLTQGSANQIGLGL